MYASTHVFVGFAESPTFVSPSDRVNGTPDTVNDTDADNVLVPTSELLTMRSEEHTSELQSLRHLVWRLVLVEQNAVSDDVTVSPAAATQPPPVPTSISTVTANVCLFPSAYVEHPDPHPFPTRRSSDPFAESPTFVSPSDRVNGTPDTVNDTDADNVLVPPAELLTM